MPPRQMVPGVGFEPTRHYGQLVLSESRMPFRHPGTEGHGTCCPTVLYRRAFPAFGHRLPCSADRHGPTLGSASDDSPVSERLPSSSDRQEPTPCGTLLRRITKGSAAGHHKRRNLPKAKLPHASFRQPACGLPGRGLHGRVARHGPGFPGHRARFPGN